MRAAQIETRKGRARSKEGAAAGAAAAEGEAAMALKSNAGAGAGAAAAIAEKSNLVPCLATPRQERDFDERCAERVFGSRANPRFIMSRPQPP